MQIRKLFLSTRKNHFPICHVFPKNWWIRKCKFQNGSFSQDRIHFCICKVLVIYVHIGCFPMTRSFSLQSSSSSGLIGKVSKVSGKGGRASSHSLRTGTRTHISPHKHMCTPPSFNFRLERKNRPAPPRKNMLLDFGFSSLVLIIGGHC